MKLLKITSLFILFFGLQFVMSSCGSKTKTDQHNHDQDKMEMKDHSAEMYACPMHPEVKGAEGDKCSKCGMPLQMMDKDDHKGHKH